MAISEDICTMRIGVEVSSASEIIRMAISFESVGDEADDVAVLRVHHGCEAKGSGGHENVEELAVAEFEGLRLHSETQL
ncbi:hypothetical protein M7I_4881 [Glarea lozoyensis 74030]|uniref:Uncharacterized protein n=1 Tax=Glarea lozoyensis (strain ATCC 74030 / MF5533) TaxID=1104152 RepID=H0EQD3_GLAL7|nr:hypothetical protein M7I_4881 [Glarea lozoyensis 74030]